MIKGIDKLKLTSEQRKLLEASEENYKRFARIYFELLDIDNKEAFVKVWQMENTPGKYLTAKELVERGREVFNGIIPDDVKIHFRPIPFNPDALKSIDLKYINARIEQLGLQPKDLVKLFDIDKSSLSLILSGQRELTKWHKAAFYYFFKSYDKMSRL